MNKKHGSLRRSNLLKLSRSYQFSNRSRNLHANIATATTIVHRAYFPNSNSAIVLMVAIIALMSLLFILKNVNLFMVHLLAWFKPRCSTVYWYGNNVFRTLYLRLCHPNPRRKSHSVWWYDGFGDVWSDFTLLQFSGWVRIQFTASSHQKKNPLRSQVDKSCELCMWTIFAYQATWQD